MKALTLNPMVISAIIGPSLVGQILIDYGSSVNTIFKKAYDRMLLEAKDLKSCKARIHGFNSITTNVVGYVELPMELGDGSLWRMWVLHFVVMDVNSP